MNLNVIIDICSIHVSYLYATVNTDWSVYVTRFSLYIMIYVSSRNATPGHQIKSSVNWLQVEMANKQSIMYR